jgi:ssRNA-specific RNase YbeY (16S rRNA maturation enzyme)
MPPHAVHPRRGLVARAVVGTAAPPPRACAGCVRMEAKATLPSMQPSSHDSVQRACSCHGSRCWLRWDLQCASCCIPCGTHKDARAHRPPGSVIHTVIMHCLLGPATRCAGVALLSVVLCDDKHIRHLNNRFRGKDYATDVLSFEMSDAIDYKVLLNCHQALCLHSCSVAMGGTAPRYLSALHMLPAHAANLYGLGHGAHPFLGASCRPRAPVSLLLPMHAAWRRRYSSLPCQLQVHLPVKLMGDLVVSLDTAQRQATERGCVPFGGDVCARAACAHGCRC